MDLVGPHRIRSTGGKWYVLVVVDDYSWYAWVFFLEEKGEMPYERSAMTMARNLKTLVSKPFAMTWIVNTIF
jgi:hypothetical protein